MIEDGAALAHADLAGTFAGLGQPLPDVDFALVGMEKLCQDLEQNDSVEDDGFWADEELADEEEDVVVEEDAIIVEDEEGSGKPSMEAGTAQAEIDPTTIKSESTGEAMMETPMDVSDANSTRFESPGEAAIGSAEAMKVSNENTPKAESTAEAAMEPTMDEPSENTDSKGR
ncbi:hypothetical protein NCC49_005294 [Naganishia albida]|nr:hypothetical protein NCC49_005294 [Naganishia albida]